MVREIIDAAVTVAVGAATWGTLLVVLLALIWVVEARIDRWTSRRYGRAGGQLTHPTNVRCAWCHETLTGPAKHVMVGEAPHPVHLDCYRSAHR